MTQVEPYSTFGVLVGHTLSSLLEEIGKAEDGGQSQ
jgi:hypothetical protein